MTKSLKQDAVVCLSWFPTHLLHVYSLFLGTPKLSIFFVLSYLYGQSHNETITNVMFFIFYFAGLKKKRISYLSESKQ